MSKDRPDWFQFGLRIRHKKSGYVMHICALRHGWLWGQAQPEMAILHETYITGRDFWDAGPFDSKNKRYPLVPMSQLKEQWEPYPETAMVRRT